MRKAMFIHQPEGNLSRFEGESPAEQAPSRAGERDVPEQRGKKPPDARERSRDWRAWAIVPKGPCGHDLELRVGGTTPFFRETLTRRVSQDRGVPSPLQSVYTVIPGFMMVSSSCCNPASVQLFHSLLLVLYHHYYYFWYHCIVTIIILSLSLLSQSL